MGAGDLFLLGLIIGALVAGWWLKQLQARRLAARLRRARRSEREAINFLAEKGYRVVDVQRREPVVMVIDGREHKGAVRADIIARKGRKTYVVEVKSGRRGEDPGKVEIRRQLLEYFLVYRPHGLVLLDMEERKMHHISFRLGGNWYNKLQGIPELWKYALAGSLGALITWLGLTGGWKE